MQHLNAAHFLAMLAVILIVARLGGVVARRLGQPGVLGELLGGVIVGRSALGLVDTRFETIQLLSELGVVILLFAIGLETDLGQLMRVGTTSMTVAVAGVGLPFVLGYLACRTLGLDDLKSIMAGATLTATSVGITARVLADLGRLRDIEGQIILGAAIIDDVLGLVVLTVVSGLTQGHEVSVASVLRTTAQVVGFLVVTIVVGRLVVPLLFRKLGRFDDQRAVTAVALAVAFGLAWLAEACGSEMIIGAFAAGLLLTKVPQVRHIEDGVSHLGAFFVPLFFVTVGASIDLSALNPLDPASRFTLLVGAILIVVGVMGKVAAGYAPFWFRGNKAVVGVGMVPRGEVGLIFARMGIDSGVFDPGLFGAATLMVLATTMIGPALLKLVLTRSVEAGGEEILEVADALEEEVVGEV